MKVFNKYLRKSMMEKKGRFFLLLTSIAISAALLVASLGSVKALLGTMTTGMKGNFGDFNVIINPGKNLEVPLFNPTDIKNLNEKKSFKGITIGGYLKGYDEKEFSLVGTSFSDFVSFDSIKTLEESAMVPFTGKKLVISKKASESLKVKLGDELKLSILGKEESYKIAAVTANAGIFFNDTESRFSMITPEENLFSIYGEKDKYSYMLASIDSKDLSAWVKDFNEKNKGNRIVASQNYDEQQLEAQLNMIRMPLYFMLAIVLFMTTFIIYSSFKLIITERLSVIGVFLSQGATKGKIIRILLRESLAYGIIGGIIGDLLGAGLTHLIAYYGNPLKQYGVESVTEYHIPYFAAGFIFAVVLSLISTLLPILSIRKLPVKDVILNTISTSNKISPRSFILGSVFIISAIIFHVLGEGIKYLGALPEFFLAFIGVILIIPKVVDVVFHPLVKLLRNINGLSMLSFNNVKTSKVLINNMRLIAVSVIAIVMITSLGNSITDVVKGAYEGMKFDVLIEVRSNYLKNIDELVRGYGDVITINETGGFMTNLNGDTSKLMYVSYVDPEKYKTFENYTVFDDKKKELDALAANEDGIIISKQMSVRYNINKGDTITLTTDNKEEKFKVLSVYNAKMMYNGNYNLISLKGALKHFDVKYPVLYFISTIVPQGDAKVALESRLKGLGTTLTTKDEMSKNNRENNDQMTGILGVFSYITMVIGAFGILSNVSISFLQRKREIAVLSSVGLTRSGRGYLIILESVFQALIGVFISLVAAYGINICMTDISKFLTMDLEMSYPFNSIAVIAFASIMLMLVTSLSSMLKSRKLQIVMELKYE